MNLFKGNSKFLIIILLIFFGGGIMTIIDNFNYNENRTGIIYQENDNIVLSEVNKSYDYNINYDLEESYLHYFPVKKSAFLDNYNNQDKNLASPDLTGKEYLGNGVYRLDQVGDFTIDYNVYNGVYIKNGTYPSGNYDMYFWGSIDFAIVAATTSDDISDNISLVAYNVGFTEFKGIRNTSATLSSFRMIRIFGVNETNNFIFKLQIEKGTTATPYEVPYIPPLRIDFKGTNQVEYINPFQEQIIKINDIKNVTNIEFDLLNTNNSVVFNWNIKTNENLPFVRYYNEEHKLIYDFTDIEEINNTGDILISNKGLLLNTIRDTFDLIDMFYSGFQKLFSKKNIDNLINIMKKAWPTIIPKWPWVRS